MSRPRFLLLVLVLPLLAACATGPRGGGGEGDDERTGPDDSDPTLIDYTHSGFTEGTLNVEGTDQPCTGSAWLDVYEDGSSDGAFRCTTADGWACSGSWSGTPAFPRVEYDDVAGDCYANDDVPASSVEGLTVECGTDASSASVGGNLWLWGNGACVAGSFSFEDEDGFRSRVSLRADSGGV